MKLKGDRCQCTMCGHFFGSTYAFDKHRHGPYSSRSCMTFYQMLESGFIKDSKGWIRTAGRLKGYVG